MNIVEFLNARLDEDEQAARAIDDKQLDSGWSTSYNPAGLANTPPGWYITPHIGLAYEEEGARHIARYDPARVLREIAIKRAIIAKLEANDAGYGGGTGPVDWSELPDARAGANYALRDALRVLCAVYSAHFDFNPEWTE